MRGEEVMQIIVPQALTLQRSNSFDVYHVHDEYAVNLGNACHGLVLDDKHSHNTEENKIIKGI